MKVGNARSATAIVYLAGIVTSLIALALVYALLIFFNFNLLGLYAWIFPVGSMMAGLAAGSGYFAVSRLLNVKTRPAFTFIAALTAIAVYTAAYYVLYAYMYQTASFGQFIGQMLANASNASLTIGKSMRSTIDKVGVFGYALLALEYAGFTLGSVLPVTYGKDKPYCADCKKFYKKGAGFALSPALENADVGNPESAEGKALIEKNKDILRSNVEKLKEAVKGKSFDEVSAHLAKACAQGVTRNTFYITFAVEKCPACGNHVISSTLNSHVNKDGGMVTEELGILSAAPIQA